MPQITNRFSVETFRSLAILFDIRTNSIGPDLIAFCSWMQEVGHNVSFDDAIRGHELWSEVFIEDGLIVGEILDDLVRGGNLRAVLVAGRVAGREDAEEQDPGVRRFLLQRPDAETDGIRCGDGTALIPAEIVDADEEHHELRIDLGEDVGRDTISVRPPESTRP